MTSSFGFLRRVAALSAAIALSAAPLTAAQTPASAAPGQPPARAALLSPSAFAKFVQVPRAGGANAPDVQDPPRRDLLRQSTAAGVRAAHASSPQPPRRGGGWSTAGKVVVGVGIVLGLIVGLAAASYYTGVDFMPLLDAFFASR